MPLICLKMFSDFLLPVGPSPNPLGFRWANWFPMTHQPQVPLPHHENSFWSDSPFLWHTCSNLPSRFYQPVLCKCRIFSPLAHLTQSCPIFLPAHGSASLSAPVWAFPNCSRQTVISPTFGFPRVLFAQLSYWYFFFSARLLECP